MISIIEQPYLIQLPLEQEAIEPLVLLENQAVICKNTWS